MAVRPTPLRLDTPPPLHYGRLKIIYDLLEDQLKDQLKDQLRDQLAQANRDAEGDRG
jgi:hypothetical protein